MLLLGLCFPNTCFQFRVYCRSSLLLTLCVERTPDATCALTFHVAQHLMVVTSNHKSQAKRVIHRRDSFIMVAELALRSERLQVGIRAGWLIRVD